MSIIIQFRLDGKTALVTGSKRGIGQAMALALAEAGADSIGVSGLRVDEDRSDNILTRIPSGRWGGPDDLKGATVFLASPAPYYITGITQPVDGRWLDRNQQESFSIFFSNL